MDYLTYRWTNISVDLAHHKIFRAKVGKGGIKDSKSVVLFPQTKI